MKLRYIYILGLVTMLFTTSCEKLLDRPPLTTMNNENSWTGEGNLRLYANKYYEDFFRGYGEGWTTTGAAYLGFTLSDDVLNLGTQGNFTRAVPTSQIWNYTSVRSINIMIERINNEMDGVLSEDAKNHWLAVARFFRAMRYSALVTSYGDVPYYDREIFNIELDELYKPRDPRDLVMDHVYDDLQFAFENIRTSDGEMQINKDIVAAYITRLALSEATWQKYYYKNNSRANKFFEFVIEAGDYVIGTGKYDIVTDYRSLFSSEDLKGNRDVILYRHYDELTLKHQIASNSNLNESLIFGPTTDLIKSYLAKDGEVWQNSSVSGADNFEIENLMKTRDPRFEASFHIKPKTTNRGSLLYITKFIPRDIEEMISQGGTPPKKYSGADNITDYPEMRYAEVLINWIEAKAEMNTVSQDDIDKSINKIRNRPLAAQAVSRGVEKLPPLTLGTYPNDPNRDPEVSPLLWEIRRERRAEFTFERSRLADLRRWKKLEYMDTEENPDLLSGAWVDFPNQLPGELKAGETGVVDLSGNYTLYNGSNDSDMVGFYRNAANKDRLPFLNQANVNPYLTPIGKNQIDEYEAKGYVLKQTEGWPQN